MNSRFHHAIIDATDNETLRDTLLRIERLPMLSFHVIAKIGARPDMSLLLGAQLDHERILKSLMAGDAERASERMVEHVRIAGDLIVGDFAHPVPESRASEILSDLIKQGEEKPAKSPK